MKRKWGLCGGEEEVGVCGGEEEVGFMWIVRCPGMYIGGWMCMCVCVGGILCTFYLAPSVNLGTSCNMKVV